MIASYRNIIRIVWPLALGMVNNAVLEFTDRTFLAHESLASLEAILPASMLAMIALGFFQAVVAYSGTFVAQYGGAGNARRCTMSYHAGVWIAFFAGLLLLTLIPVGGWVFETFSNGAEIIARQKTYYGICTAGGICLMGQMAAQSYFTGRGRTRLIFWVNVLGNLLNVLLDWIMIFGHWGCPALGIGGAAGATVLATFVQWIALALAVHRETREANRRAPCALTEDMRELILRILKFGVPSGGYSVLNILSFTIFVFITGRVGHLEAAVSNACFSLCYLLFAPMEGFALGAATLVGHAQGRGDSAGAMQAGRRTLALGLAFVTVLSVLMLVFHRPILSLFASTAGEDAERFHQLGFILCLVMAAWQIFDAADVILSGALKGAGDTRFVFWWIFLTAFVLWLPIVFLVAAVHNTMPALWATNLAYIFVICTGTCLRWHSGRWQRIRLV